MKGKEGSEGSPINMKKAEEKTNDFDNGREGQIALTCLYLNVVVCIYIYASACIYKHQDL
jgi:hypothetical protein